MTPVWLWFRSGTGRYAALVILAVQAFGVLSSGPAWQFEWELGLRNTVRTFPLVCAVLAGVAAHDTYRMVNPAVDHARYGRFRWRRTLAALAVAQTLWAFLAVSASQVATALWLLRSDAIGSADRWLPAETFVALLAASSLGVLWGVVIRGPAAPAVAAVVSFAIQALALPLGLSNLFAPPGLVSPAVGVTRADDSALYVIALNLAVGALLLAAALRGPRTTAGWTAGLVIAAVAVVAVVAYPTPKDKYVTTAEGSSCVQRAEVRVCGPSSAGNFLVESAEALAGGRQTLASSGLPLPTDFELAVPGQLLPNDRPIAFLAPVDLRTSRRAAAVAQALALPRVCPSLQGGPDTTQLLDLQATVQDWMRATLTQGQVGEQAPTPVRDAYAGLVACDVNG